MKIMLGNFEFSINVKSSNYWSLDTRFNVKNVFFIKKDFYSSQIIVFNNIIWYKIIISQF